VSRAIVVAVLAASAVVTTNAEGEVVDVDHSPWDRPEVIALVTVSRHVRALRACAARHAGPTVGRLEIYVAARKTGVPRSVRIDAAPELARVSACVRKEVARWRFWERQDDYEDHFPVFVASDRGRGLAAWYPELFDPRAGARQPEFAQTINASEHKSALRACVEQAHLPQPQRLDLTVVVGRTGRVKTVSIEAPPALAGLSNCVRQEIRRWRFPARPEGYEGTFPMFVARGGDAPARPE
jgi:hypothetical protein